MTTEAIKTLAGGQEDDPRPQGMGGAALQHLLSRVTTTADGSSKMRRRRMRFMIAPDVWELGVDFQTDVALVIQSPNSDDELTALKRSDGNQTAMVFELIKLGMVSLDGSPLSTGDLSREAVWEALGFQGRQMIADRWKELNEPGEAARKKAVATTVLI